MTPFHANNQFKRLLFVCLLLASVGTGVDRIALAVMPFIAATWNQQWTLLTAPKCLFNVNVNRCLDIYGANVNDGASIVSHPCNYGSNQLWRLA